jgi:hypothetical protein
MYSDKAAKSRAWLWILLALILLAALVFGLVSAAGSENGRDNAAAAIRRTVESSARQCYVIEGVYPPDLEYLEQNYGLQINTNEFYVSYEIYASNQPPTVKVVGK